MKYTCQIYVNGYASPKGDDVHHATSLSELRGILESERDQAKRLGAAYESDDLPGGANMLVWIGHLEDVTDMYPGFELVFGPRGGIHRAPC